MKVRENILKSRQKEKSSKLSPYNKNQVTFHSLSIEKSINNKSFNQAKLARNKKENG